MTFDTIFYAVAIFPKFNNKQDQDKQAYNKEISNTGVVPGKGKNSGNNSLLIYRDRKSVV